MISWIRNKIVYFAMFFLLATVCYGQPIGTYDPLPTPSSPSSESVSALAKDFLIRVLFRKIEETKQQFPQEYKELLMQEFGTDEIDSGSEKMAGIWALGTMRMLRDPFIFSDLEAKRMMAGEFDDTENKENIEYYMGEFDKAGGVKPIIVDYLIEYYEESPLSGFDLEFTERILRKLMEMNLQLKIRS